MYHGFYKNITQQNFFSILIIIRNHQISIVIISEGSCDTEDWSNDADNSFNHLKKNYNNNNNFTVFFSVFQIK